MKKTFFKKLFCKHEYKWQKRISIFTPLNGHEEYLRCPKCGKIKKSRWCEYIN